MNSSVGHVVSHNTTAFIAFHDEVHGEVLHKENAIVTKSATEESMKHRVASSVSDSAAAVSLSTLSEVCGLASESALVNLTLSSSRERHAVGLEFTNGDRGLTSHVLHCVLVSKPVTTLDSVVEVPAPVVVVHVTESGINTSLSGNSVRAGGEKLGDASSLESSL